MRRIVLPLVATFALASAALAQDFDGAARTVAPRVIAHYERLHQYPELGKQETRTAAYVKTTLAALGYARFEIVAGLPTAVITIYDTGAPGPTVALRADIDARKQQEATNLPYASTTPGLMHSCGHDAHTAMLLGVAEALPRIAKRGKIVLIFQPAEETAGGADDIVADGLLERLGVTAMIGQHVVPGLAVGTAQLSPGQIMAGSNYFTLTVTGRESHAAAPHDGDDVTTCAAALASELPTVFARRTDILAQPALLSVTYLNAGKEDSLNVIPREATIKGTIRSFHDIDENVGSTTLRTMLTEFVARSVERCGGAANLTIREASPPTVNDAHLAARVLPAVQAVWKTPIGSQPRGMFSEDFAYYTTVIPSIYFSLGIQKNGLGKDPVHTTTFTVHPDALTEGVKLLLAAAYAAAQR